MKKKEEPQHIQELKKQFYELAKSNKGKTKELGANFLPEITKAFHEVMLEAEMTEHLGYEKHERSESENSRNGTSSKTIRGDFGEVVLDIPRDRNGDFEPVIIEKHKTNGGNFTEKIISLYSRGMTTREIAEHLQEIYGVEVSPMFISKATDSLKAEVDAWRTRRLESVYAICYFDGIRFSIRDNATVKKSVVYVALGVDVTGKQDVLGLWHAETESAAFWANVCMDLQARGVSDILIACADGLTGLPDAITAVFPKTDVQLCVVHQIRASTRFVNYKDRKAFCADLKNIYCAQNIVEAETALSELQNIWGKKYPASVRSWITNFDKVTTFFRYPVELRKVVYTTNSIEALNAVLRKNTSNRKVFTTLDSLLKILVVNIKKMSSKWTVKQHWGIIYNQLAMLYPDRVSIDPLEFSNGSLNKVSAIVSTFTQN
jgi:putative transposase